MNEAHHPTICHYLLDKNRAQSDDVALLVASKKEWKTVQFKDYINQIRKVFGALRKLGVKKGDRVGIMSNTRHEWAVCDFAIMALGGVTVPIYPNSSVEDLSYVINDSNISVLFLESRSMFKQILLARESCPCLNTIIGFEKVLEEDAQLLPFSSFIEFTGSELENHHAFNQSIGSLSVNDWATIIYTSGTTGKPKGVLLTHQQIISQVSETFTSVGFHNEDITLAFLPFSHVLGRSELWGQMFIGYKMALAESIEKLKPNLLTIKPTILVSVPRIFEKIYTFIIAQAQTSKIQMKVLHWAIQVGQEYENKKLTSKKFSPVLMAKYKIADKLLLSKIRNAMGGRIRFCVSGGAPLVREIGEFFHAAGIIIIEGYGLTECTGPIFANRPWNPEFGTVGKPIGDVQLKLADDGEILIKSPKVMKEYFNLPQDTQQSIQDGWLHTGDIGELTSKGNLKITDRKKDLIKTAGGKYVAPQKLEGVIKKLPFISNVHIHGDQRKYIVALLTLDRKYLLDFAKENMIVVNDFSELKDHPKVQEFIRSGITSANSSLASYESIKKYAVLENDFTMESGELTPSMKVKRKIVEKNYKVIIDGLY